MQTLLSVENLTISFHHKKALLTAVHGISFQVTAGETLGIVGESGCGKSVSCMSVMRLLPEPATVYGKDSRILFDGSDLLRLPAGSMRKIRGREISMIFQEPMTALNPLYTVGNQMAEAIAMHEKVSRREASARCVEQIRKVRIPEAAQMMECYPYQLSGGMRQRVMIAMAMLTKPRLIIADEPTTALDVTIQAQILDLINELKAETHTSCIFVSHDLGVISEVTDRVLVMYGGRVCETAPTRDMFRNALHPYTQGLIRSRPAGALAEKRLRTIPGNVPNLKDLPAGCPFHTRCMLSKARCGEAFPAAREAAPGHWVACFECGVGV
jgi:oligopeptide/dipeptide ABC transporter ATP-binding protein